MMDWVSAVLLIVGAVFSLIAAIGVLRMPDFYSRLQNSTKASTLGVGSVVLAGAFHFGDTGTVTQLLLVLAFLVLTSPVAAHMICRAAYAEEVPFWKGTIVDELKGTDEEIAKFLKLNKGSQRGSGEQQQRYEICNANIKLKKLQQLIDRISNVAGDQEKISLGMIMDEVGSRSFGPLLLMAGVILFSPLSGIPGMPTTMGVFVFLIALQLLFRRQCFWVPRWLRERSMTRSKVQKALKWLRPPARYIDFLMRPRLTFFLRGAGTYIIALICAVIAAGMPVMELVPFSATGSGAALIAFGLSLVSHDGLAALLAFIVTAATLGLVVYKVL